MVQLSTAIVVFKMCILFSCWMNHVYPHIMITLHDYRTFITMINAGLDKGVFMVTLCYWVLVNKHGLDKRSGSFLQVKRKSDSFTVATN